ncbi:MAG: type ISP restriction/modification enzyme [Oceanicaulis sp.]
MRRNDPAVIEPALAPAFRALIEALVGLLPVPQSLQAAPEYNQPGAGRPDIALKLEGGLPRAFIELKAPNRPSDPTRWTGAEKRQYHRLRELGVWATSNFHELRLFERDAPAGVVTLLPAEALEPATPDAHADRLIDGHATQPFLDLATRLLNSAAIAPAAQSAPQLATLLAHSARLVRETVRERLRELDEAEITNDPLQDVRAEFRNVLYAHPEAGGYTNTSFDELFSAAFAQTLAFGLLLVREATNADVTENAWRDMPEEHPLMRTALRVVSMPEVVEAIGVGFEVMRDTVNSFDPAILALQPNGRDPILYFYEEFLETFDPDARERHGVYYTPVEVVRYMAGALDRALREHLDVDGFMDARVNILDPAVGTGTFLLGVAERVREQQGGAGAGMAAAALHDLARRMYGFELLVGPYAVAHYRLHHTLRRGEDEHGDDVEMAPFPRLGVYLSDTLAEPGADAPGGQLGFVSAGISEERREANRIKTEQPILAIIGNPPYRRLKRGENETLVGRWMDGLWEDLKEPVRNAGKANQLNTFPEMSVAFWRWAIWKLFEAENAPQRGVVAFITNRKFLTGWPYAGLRQMMRERFDRIEIIDLRGDVRAGVRGGIDADVGVFDIQVGTAITLAIADGSRNGAPAEVHYLDSWAESRFSRRAKLDWLTDGAEDGRLANAVPVERERLDNMRPLPFQNGEWVSLDEAFQFKSSGMESKRDPAVYAPTSIALTAKINRALEMNIEQFSEFFHGTDQNPAHRARSVGLSDEFVRPASYRPFDVRAHYAHRTWNDRLRTDLTNVWGDQNLCLFTLPGGVKAGPGAWCHHLYPDRHAFRGSYGGYAFPLYDRRPGGPEHNLRPALLEALGVAYGGAVTPEQVFDAMLALLSATSYSVRFAEDLEDVFPHIPFPAERAVFEDAARIGARIRAVETFAAPPADPSAGFARVVTQPSGPLAPVVDEDAGEVILCEDGSGHVTGLPRAVLEFKVSGYSVLANWLADRAGLEADFDMIRQFRDVAMRIAELLDLCDSADPVLDRAVDDPLTREALGFEDA